MTEILAVQPSQLGRILHLHLPGYQPGRKRRPSPEAVAMCGINIGDLRISLSSAADLRRIQTGFIRPPDWCRTCIGHAVLECGLADQVIATLIAAMSNSEGA